AFASAQDVPPAAPGDDQAGPPASSEPGYGDSSVLGGDDGPQVLSRGGGPSIGGPNLRLRPFVTLNGVYDSGLATTSVNSHGNVPFVDAYGVETTFGATGSRNWAHSQLDLDYRGAFRHYTKQSYYDGMDNSLTLSLRHYLTARTYIRLDENAARYQRAFSLPLAGYYNTGFYSYDPSYSGMTTNNFFDSPTLALQSTGRIVHQRSARLSFSAGATGFLMQRRSQSLIGSSGYTVMGDVAYRLSRYQTIAFQYNFAHYSFRNSFGQSDMHGVSASYSVRARRNLEIAVLGGAIRVESLRLTRILFDPVVAALLGQSFGIEKFYGVAYMPRLGGRITQRFHYSDISLSYDRAVLAGNGVFTTSSYEMASIGYDYRAMRRASIQAGINYQRYSALTQNLGRYRNYSAGVGFGYRLAKGFSLIGRADARRYQMTGSSLNRIYSRVVVGVGWSPADYPLALW
ncbi:MAG TPA: hypothetical protein VF767_11185, partial [Bryobacteraceae bacterium]